MDSSLHKEGSRTQQRSSRDLLGGLKILTSLIYWLAGIINLTEEEREDAGIYLDRPGGE